MAILYGSNGWLLPDSDNMAMWATICQLRTVRVIATALIGSYLAIAGVIYQSVFRNPLVSPDLLGASSGAAVGVVLCLWCGASYSMLPLGALLFGLTATALCVIFAYLIAGFNILVLILCGILFSSLLASLLQLANYFSPDIGQLLGVQYFLLGSLNNLSLQDIGLLLGFGLPALIGISVYAKQWNILALPFTVVQSQGFNLKLIVFVAISLATLLSAVTVAVAGIIGWVAIVIPNLVRYIVGGKLQILLPFSALAGATFLVLADLLARTVAFVEIPIGVITGIIGAPCFIIILFINMRRKKG